jgi:cyclic beta-1,2-glucan synthetase
MLRAGVESILGLTLHGSSLSLAPCIPPSWPGFELNLNLDGTRWHIQVSDPRHVSRGVHSLVVDGKHLPPASASAIPLPHDSQAHTLAMELGPE